MLPVDVRMGASKAIALGPDWYVCRHNPGKGYVYLGSRVISKLGTPRGGIERRRKWMGKSAERCGARSDREQILASGQTKLYHKQTIRARLLVRGVGSTAAHVGLYAAFVGGVHSPAVRWG